MNEVSAPAATRCQTLINSLSAADAGGVINQSQTLARDRRLFATLSKDAHNRRA